MMHKIFKTAAILLFLLPATAISQTLESILEDFEEDQVPELEELLRSLVNEPIAINKISADSLVSLWFINVEQADALISLHKSTSPNISIRQISEAINLPEEIVRILFSVDRPIEIDHAFRIRSIQKTNGWQQNFRFDSKMNRLSIGFLSEKDPEESRLDDFTASYLSFKPLGENSQIIVGNFAIQNGAGLVFAGPFGLPVLSQPRRAVSFSPTRTLPYRTTGENMAFKGGVLMHAFPQFQIVIMHSNVKRDAHMTEDNQVSSRPVDGLHVTDGQIAARNTLGEASTGVIVNFMPKSNFKIGANVLSQRFNHSILPKDTIRQKFAFRGNTNTLYGVNLCFITPDQRISIVGETAICEKGAAAVIGLNLNLGRTIFTSGYWFADPGFHNTYGALPGNRVGDMANQRAFYAGLESRSIVGKLLIFAIRRSTPWRTFFQPMPVLQEDFGLQWERRLRNSHSLLLKFKYRSGENFVFANASSQQPAGEIVMEDNRFTLRLQFRTRLHKGVNYRVRFDGTALTGLNLNEGGTSQIHEISFRSVNIAFGLSYGYFSTESYSSRIYHFENTLPGLLYPRVLFGTGEMMMAYFRWSFLAHCKISSYFSYTNKFNLKRDLNFGVQFEHYN